MSKNHELKIYPKYFEPVAKGEKRAELRRNDRDYECGDTLVLREWDPKTGYTGKKVMVKITHITELWDWIENYVLLSIELLKSEPAEKHDVVSWNELSERGLVFRVNHEIMHPLGLAIMYDPESGTSDGALVAADGIWSYSEEIMQTAKKRGWI